MLALPVRDQLDILTLHVEPAEDVSRGMPRDEPPTVRVVSLLDLC
jgi:hypothetical protein